jgi:protein-arginine kinase activator protein McsA
MLCSICKEKTATVHLTDIKGDKFRQVDLCEECAMSKGITESTFTMADSLFSSRAFTDTATGKTARGYEQN